MKITEFGPIGKPGSVSKKNTKKVTSDFGSVLEGAEAADDTTTPEVATTAPTNTTNMIDSLIAIQQVDSDYGESKKAVDHGNQLLDSLNEIKNGVLNGGVSMEGLEKLKNGLQNERGWTVDDKLSSVINEIETRAKVEIAKIDPNRE